MKTVKIGEFRNRLSHYLRLVQDGEAILIADRDRLIARIDPIRADRSLPRDDAEWLDRLERSGTIRRGTGQLPPGWPGARVHVGGDVVAALLRDREESP